MKKKYFIIGATTVACIGAAVGAAMIIKKKFKRNYCSPYWDEECNYDDFFEDEE